MFIFRKTYVFKTGFKKIWHISDGAIQSLLKVSISDNAYYRHKYNLELEAAVNKQIQVEQQAAQDYLNVAISLLHPSVSKPGAGGFFMSMYHEELQHMEQLIKYQLHRGGMPVIQAVTAPAPQHKITLIEAFKLALAMEHCITELIEQLIAIAEKNKDHNCVNFVTTVFLEEQMNAIDELSHHVMKISSISDNADALQHYDLQLLNAYKNIHMSQKK